MRIWSLHPKYLDARGLIALWRETLLAQAVLRGATRGYTHHPQLARFRAQADAPGCVAAYLQAVHAEAAARGYRFDAARIGVPCDAEPIAVTRGQLEFEWTHLRAKLTTRDPAWMARLPDIAEPQPHPLFRIVAGAVEPWERGAAAHRPAPAACVPTHMPCRLPGNRSRKV